MIVNVLWDMNSKK